MQNVDVAIVGGGMVGLTLACGLQGSGLRVAVLEQNVPQPVAQDAPPELRVSAINAASEKLLTHLGVWSEIVAQRASCYHGMEVWDKDSFGHIAFWDTSSKMPLSTMLCGKRRSPAAMSRCWHRRKSSRSPGEKTTPLSPCKAVTC